MSRHTVPAISTRTWAAAMAATMVAVLMAWPAQGHAADIDQAVLSIPVAGGTPVEARVFTVDPAKIYIDVLPASAMKKSRDGGDAGGAQGVSLKDAANTSVVGRVILERALLVNGGFSENDRPDGLIISRDEVVSLPNFTTRAADPKSDCAGLRVERKKLSGLLCIARDRSASIQPVDKVKTSACYQALQAGPLLVAADGLADVCPNAPGSEQKKTAAQPRTALCLRGGKLSVVLTSAPIELFDLAQWLAAPAGAGGLACESALNLAGGAASGAVYFPGGIPSFSKRAFWGGKTQSNASYVLLHSMKF